MSAGEDRSDKPPIAAARPREAPAGAPRVVTSDALLRGDAQLAILHEQTLYFLRRTRFGKLILTK
jgi:hemin uptake protein HemP